MSSQAENVQLDKISSILYFMDYSCAHFLLIKIDRNSSKASKVIFIVCLASLVHSFDLRGLRSAQQYKDGQ